MSNIYNNNNESLLRDSVLRVGTVTEVSGLKVSVTVDKEKNSSDIFFNGELIRNVSVDSFIEIRKGFIKLIGKIEGEIIKKEIVKKDDVEKYISNMFTRTLTLSLIGYIDIIGKFIGGRPKELPLIGNEAFIITNNELEKIYDINDGNNDLCITIGKTYTEEMPVRISIDKLFGSHIAIFGNTGSGKSNTLAKIYNEFLTHKDIKENESIKTNCKFLLLDFNGEYSSEESIITDKNIIKLSTNKENGGDKIKLKQDTFLDVNFFSIISEATEKTQKPFLKRALSYYKKFSLNKNKETYIQNILKQQVERILTMSEKDTAYLLLDYMQTILNFYKKNEDEYKKYLCDDINWHDTNKYFYKLTLANDKSYKTNLQVSENCIKTTKIYVEALNFKLEKENTLDNIIIFMYIQLVNDILSNRAKDEHISPVINRLISNKSDIDKVLDISKSEDFFEGKNFMVIDLKDTNLQIKKIIPLLICKSIYDEYKVNKNDKSKYLNIIIDEAHNILSDMSKREADSWKDYRLETFEEIIKEGRKFGVFITISSQRPMDISNTITSQMHNFFIHKLVNNKDLDAIKNAVSYIDKLSEDTIPTLPPGTCIFSGTASSRPLLLSVEKLNDEQSPKSETIKISNIIKLQINQSIDDDEPPF